MFHGLVERKKNHDQQHVSWPLLYTAKKQKINMAWHFELQHLMAAFSVEKCSNTG